MVVNHYIIKSAEEYEIKKKRGDALFKVSPKTNAYFQCHDLNDVNDETLMVDYARAIKENIRKRKKITALGS